MHPVSILWWVKEAERKSLISEDAREKPLTTMKERRDRLERKWQQKWDSRWRVVIFDFPDTERKLRDNFRNLLKSFGFKKLQISVWACPYDVYDELELLIPDIKRHDWIKLLLVDVIIGERSFKKLFKL